MKEPSELEFDTLKKRLEINRKAQKEIEKEIIGQAQTREKLADEMSKTCGAVFDLIGIYTELPTDENKRLLTEARRAEELAKRALTDFDICTNHDDLELLTDNEKSILARLQTIKKYEGSDSLQNEYESLKEKLTTMFPRYLALHCAEHNIPPGRLSVEALILKDFDYRIKLDHGYSAVMDEIQGVEKC